MIVRKVQNKGLYIISLGMFIIDIISKLVVVNYIEYDRVVTIISNFFNLNYVRNTGGAFGILEGNVVLIVMVTIIIFFYIFRYLNKSELNLLQMWGFGLIIGGAIGNLFDRIVYGYVIDFLDFYIFNYNFPVFNLADCGIVIGGLLILIDGFLFESSDNCENKGRR